MAIEIPRPLHPFLFFGCWNTRGAARDAVAAKIRANERDVPVLILGGDNVYPLEGNESKLHRRDVFEEGMELYSQFEHGAGKFLFPSLGNHNVKKDIRAVQMERYSKYLKPDKTYYMLRFTDGFHVIVLDTNTMDSDAMIEWLRGAIHDVAAAREPYYIVQHEPMISMRHKKGADKASVLIGCDRVMQILNRYPPIHILCADTHNFQYGSVTFGEGGVAISQLVVGTGGANLDDLPERAGPFTVEEGGLKYEYMGGKKVYGYLRIDDPDTYKFVQVARSKKSAAYTATRLRAWNRSTRRRRSSRKK
jgi:hypothetical protein